jgi:hypothetical protein
MPRRYFHHQNGVTTLDPHGIDASDMAAIRDEAVATIAAILREDDTGSLWSNKPLRLWVTDDPDGKGRTLLALELTAREAEPS